MTEGKKKKNLEKLIEKLKNENIIKVPESSPKNKDKGKLIKMNLLIKNNIRDEVKIDLATSFFVAGVILFFLMVNNNQYYHSFTLKALGLFLVGCLEYSLTNYFTKQYLNNLIQVFCINIETQSPIKYPF